MGKGTWSGRILRFALVIFTGIAGLSIFSIFLTQRLTPTISLRYLLDEAGDNKLAELQASHEQFVSDLQMGLAARIAPYGKDAWSPDGRKLAFVVASIDSNTGHYDYISMLWLLDLDSSNLELLGQTTHWFTSLSWSADSRYLTYVSGLPRSIHLVDTEPPLHFDPIPLPRELTENLRRTDLPAWSPVEPGVLAFVASLLDHDELVMMDFYDARRFDAKEISTSVRQLIWSPDGERLYLQLDLQRNQRISDVLVETDEDLLGDQSGVEVPGTVYAFSTNGYRFAYVSMNGESVYVIENGSAPRLLITTEGGGIIQDLVWDEFSRLLAFSEARSTTCHLFLVDVGRGLVVKLFAAESGVCRTDPVWVQDS